MKREERLYSLDLLRGLDMFLLTVVGPFVVALNGTTPLPKAFMRQFSHPYGGFTLWDIIMPLFIFMCGAAVPFALGRRIGEKGRPKPGYWRHVLTRVVLLWLLGLVAQGRLLSLDVRLISPFDNTLQSIASGYLIAAFVFLVPNRRIRISVPIVLAALYALLMHFCGDYSMWGNVGMKVENFILPIILPTGSRVQEMADPGFTWFLTVLMFGAMTLCGMETTLILRAKDDPKVRFRKVAFLGLALLAVGWALVPWIPMIKHTYTFTFTAQAMGWSCLTLAILFYLTDILKWRKGLGIFVLFGQTALLAYLAIEVFGGTFAAFGAFVTQGVPHAIGAAARPLATWLASSVLLVCVLCVWRRAKSRTCACSSVAKDRSDDRSVFTGCFGRP